MSEAVSEAVPEAAVRDLESHARLPEKGRNQEDILHELRAVAAREDARWETGQISGSYYHAGKDHFAFLNQVYGLFSHVNILQRDMCPSGTKFEAEIVAMTASMLHGDAAPPADRSPPPAQSARSPPRESRPAR